MIRLIIWVVVLVLALSFFGISLQGLWEDPTTQNNFSFITDLLKEGWDILVDWFIEFRDFMRGLLPD